MKTVTKYLTLATLMTPLLFAGNLSSCKGCHGSNFEKVALGKSKVVKDMTQEEIASTLKGYRDGTYGGAMKEVMRKAVASLSDEEINTMAAQIKE